ncbi:nitroreductase/quinone reductase family protein [Geodermatophilus normandii]|uniref:Nitroreductase family deazaflavin-dependent oxidoreductase n=1 Tax=Geodermatophilus normandii TaxID=1137989 RepID=A0A6P0G9P3_9ACTN|nr:nitroreductase family deazaflavin-dependent oxidoreductase [Geodermatophilus normandii]
MSTPAAGVRNRLVDPVLRALSRGPGRRLLGRRLVVLGYTGRRTGRRLELPVMAAPDGDDLVVLVGDAVGKTWWRNLEDGPRVVRARLLRPGEPGRDDAVAAHRAALPRVAGAPDDPLVGLERSTSRLPAERSGAGD